MIKRFEYIHRGTKLTGTLRFGFNFLGCAPGEAQLADTSPIGYNTCLYAFLLLRKPRFMGGCNFGESYWEFKLKVEKNASWVAFGRNVIATYIDFVRTSPKSNSKLSLNLIHVNITEIQIGLVS